MFLDKKLFDLIQFCFRSMLGGEDNRVDPDRSALFIILYGHLRLSVRAELAEEPALARLADLAGHHGVATVTVDPVEQFFLFPLPFDLLFQLFILVRSRAIGAVGVRRHATVDGQFGAVGIVGKEVVPGVFHPELRLFRAEQAFFLFESMQFVETVEQGDGAETALQFFEFRDLALDLLALLLVLDQFAFAVEQRFGGFDNVFSRQVEGLGNPGDLLVLFSTSGNAENLSRAFNMAKEKSMKTLAILGRDGGRLAGLADVEIIIKGTDTGRIQEAHQLLMHILLDGVDRRFVKRA